MLFNRNRTQNQLINETICTVCPLHETYIISFSTANRHVILGFSVTVLTSMQLQIPKPDLALPLEVVNSKDSFLFLTLSI